MALALPPSGAHGPFQARRRPRFLFIQRTMQYTSFSAFVRAIKDGLRSDIGRLPRGLAWIFFLLGGLFLYSEIHGPTTVVLFGRQADGVVESIRYVSGRHAEELPTIRYLLPDGKTAEFETLALLRRRFVVGEHLRIRYVPWWPKRAEIFSFGQLFSPLIIGWVGAYIFLRGGAGILRARKQRIIDQQNLAAFIAGHAPHRPSGSHPH
jgi:hypothetical protein